jgi:hypothetical protein
MAGISALAAIGGAFILTRPVRSDHAVYGRRIAGTMALAFAIILALYAWGLERVGG